MQYHIQPLVKRLGITQRVSWQTFRSTFTSLLTANNENVKVVQELLRHASSKITIDVYAQARMQDKRSAQLRIVKGLRKPDKNRGKAKKGAPWGFAGRAPPGRQEERMTMVVTEVVTAERKNYVTI